MFEDENPIRKKINNNNDERANKGNRKCGVPGGLLTSQRCELNGLVRVGFRERTLKQILE